MTDEYSMTEREREREREREKYKYTRMYYITAGGDDILGVQPPSKNHACNKITLSYKK